MTHILINESREIRYMAYVPEKSDFVSVFNKTGDCRAYQDDLEKAKRESLPFDREEDRQSIEDAIYMRYGNVKGSTAKPRGDFELKPGIYQVPVEVEIVEKLGIDNTCETFDSGNCFCPYPCGKKKVARIVQPKDGECFAPQCSCPEYHNGRRECIKPKPESQEELWNDVDNNYIRWNDQEIKLPELLKDFEIIRRK